MGMGTQVSKSNGDKEISTKDGANEKLSKEETTTFRGLAARLNFMSLDGPDLQFPIKECSREMGSPTRGSWGFVKKLCRYLLGRESVMWIFQWQEEVDKSDVYTDSDWGG